MSPGLRVVLGSGSWGTDGWMGRWPGHAAPVCSLDKGAPDPRGRCWGRCAFSRCAQ